LVPLFQSAPKVSLDVPLACLKSFVRHHAPERRNFKRRGALVVQIAIEHAFELDRLQKKGNALASKQTNDETLCCRDGANQKLRHRHAPLPRPV
jgi:hypothetical protein